MLADKRTQAGPVGLFARLAQHSKPNRRLLHLTKRNAAAATQRTLRHTFSECAVRIAMQRGVQQTRAEGRERERKNKNTVPNVKPRSLSIPAVRYEVRIGRAATRSKQSKKHFCIFFDFFFSFFLFAVLIRGCVRLFSA